MGLRPSTPKGRQEARGCAPGREREKIRLAGQAGPTAEDRRLGHQPLDAALRRLVRRKYALVDGRVLPCLPHAPAVRGGGSKGGAAQRGLLGADVVLSAVRGVCKVM